MMYQIQNATEEKLQLKCIHFKKTKGEVTLWYWIKERKKSFTGGGPEWFRQDV
jgi:hypothetical protein